VIFVGYYTMQVCTKASKRSYVDNITHFIVQTGTPQMNHVYHLKKTQRTTNKHKLNIIYYVKKMAIT